MNDNENSIPVLYKNWKGETSIRNIVPIAVRWGTSEWHREPQYLLSAFDVEKGDSREFALSEMDFTVTRDTPTFNLVGLKTATDEHLLGALSIIYAALLERKGIPYLEAADKICSLVVETDFLPNRNNNDKSGE